MDRQTEMKELVAKAVNAALVAKEKLILGYFGGPVDPERMCIHLHPDGTEEYLCDGEPFLATYPLEYRDGEIIQRYRWLCGTKKTGNGSPTNPLPANVRR